MAPVPGASGAALLYARVQGLGERHRALPAVLQARGDAGGLPAGAARAPPFAPRAKGGGGVIMPDPQLGLDLRAVPEARPPVDPRTLRVDRIEPAAPDGEEFFFSFLAAARAVSAECGGRFLPAQVRARCKTLGVEPPHQNHWGVAWGRLPRYGFRRTDAQELSHTASRNAARECVWVEVDRAAGPVEAPRE